MIGRIFTLLRCLVQRLHLFWGDLCELEERRALLDRPWEENFLHWSDVGESWELHGEFVSPPRRRTRSVTSRGWCPGSSCAPRS